MLLTIVFIFFLSFLKVCFHTILNKSKNIVFHVNSPPPLDLYLPLIDFRPQSLVIPPRYQAAVFSLADASSIVLDNSFRKHSAIIIQYFFLIWTLVSVYIQRNPALRPPRFTTTSCLSSPPIVFRPRHENLRLIFLFWRPLQCDHLAITTRILWPNAGRINGVPLYFLISVFHIVEQKTKKKMSVSWTMEINVKN